MNTTQARQYIERLDTAAEHRSVPFATGRSMRWRIFGSGDPLVLVHGGHGSWLHWIRNIEALSQRHSLFVPDLPGFGASDDLPEGSDILTIVDAVIATLDSLVGHGSKVDVAGFSFGAVVSARVAVKRGAIRRLALMGSPGSKTPPRPRAQLVRWRSTDAAAQDAALRHNLLAHMMYAEQSADALAFLAYVDAIRATRFRGRGSAHKIPLKDLLAPRTGPTLFLYGEHDVICTPELARHTLADAHASREFRVIPGSGHWVQLEAAGAINSELARWFGADVSIRADAPTGQLI
jgi:pimeloyl-ACP methyl ester carboxylesterase